MNLFNPLKFFLITSLLCSAPVVFATDNSCASRGYTILSINGVFTNKEGANRNKKALEDRLDSVYATEPLMVDFLLNPSHIAGIGDIAKVAYQKYFEERAVNDYDLANMIKDASQKVKTQKLLLVPHSQGNFYANSFYDKVADQVGGIPAHAMAVYGVANPANRVAGGGAYLTSSTDKIIAGLVDSLPFQAITLPNTAIQEVSETLNPFETHAFAGTYLKYRGDRIVADIQKSLEQLSADPERREDIPCLDAPKLSIANHVEGGVVAGADFGLRALGSATAFTLKTTYQSLVTTATLGINTVLLTARVGGMIGDGIISGTVFVVHVVGSGVAYAYTTTLSVFKGNSELSENFASSNKASILGAFEGSTRGQDSAKEPRAELPLEPKSPKVFVPENQEEIIPLATNLLSIPIIPAPETHEAGEPHLVFLGYAYPGFGGAPAPGNGPAPVPPASQQNPKEPEHEVLNSESDPPPEVEEETPVAVSAPVIEAPQCAFSLALDGCLLATTTLRFQWESVENADHYALSLNGIQATTSQPIIDVTAPDFSDYVFEISTVGTQGQVSATSTKTISVATIPIAINEIAWMGTQASANDEWMELKNNTNYTLDLAQWALESADGTPFIQLSNTLAPHGYLVLERTDETTISDMVAHALYNGALSNSGEQLTLSYASTTIDSTPLGVWASGINTSSSTRQTMERYASKESGSDILNWGTNLGFVKNGLDALGNEILGTPGARNSVSYLINKGQNITDDYLLPGDETYILPATLLISASSTLFIEPGTTISFLKDTSGNDGAFLVEGRLIAEGTSEEPIIFNSFSGNKAGEFIFSGTNTQGVVDYAHIENLEGEISATQGADLRISNSIFENSESGINAYYGSTITVSSSTVRTINNDAFGAYDDSVLTISSSTIETIPSGDAIGVYDGSTLELSDSTIQNLSGWGDAIGVYEAHADITNTTISHGESDAVGIYDSTATISGMTVSDFPQGLGLGVFGDSSVSITDSEISGTDIGLLAEQGSVPDPLPESVSVHDNGYADVYIMAP